MEGAVIQMSLPARNRPIQDETSASLPMTGRDRADGRSSGIAPIALDDAIGRRSQVCGPQVFVRADWLIVADKCHVYLRAKAPPYTRIIGAYYDDHMQTTS